MHLQPPSETLFVGNLAQGTDRDDLYNAFGAYGTVKLVYISPLNTDRPTRFGFVHFTNQMDCNHALRDMDGRYICGTQIMCRYARPRADRPGFNPPQDPQMPPPIYQRPEPEKKAVDPKGSVFAPDFIERWQNIARETQRSRCVR